MAIVYGFVLLFLFVVFMVWRGMRHTPHLELDVQAMPEEDVFAQGWASLTEDEIRDIILKVNYYDQVAKLVFYREGDGTEGVYHMSKKNVMLAYATDLMKCNLIKQQENGNGAK